MTGPPTTGKKKNLTILSLPPPIPYPEPRGEVQNLCHKALLAAEFAREHRNKHIAHQDYDYLRNRNSDLLSGIGRAVVEDALAVLRAILNRLDLHLRDSTVI